MSSPTLSDAEQSALCVSFRDGLKARDRLVEYSQGLVRQLAYEMAKRTPGVEVDDLIQEGNFALLDAMKWFDATKGFKFTTYMADCVRRRLGKYLATPKAQPLPQEPIAVEGENASEGLEELPEPVSPERVAEIFGGLTETERSILAARHGQVKDSFQAIAERLHISPATARRVYEAAVVKLGPARPPVPSVN